MIGCSPFLMVFTLENRVVHLLADPISLTISGTATSFLRVSSSSKRTQNGLVDQSVYRTSDGGYNLTVSEFYRPTSVLDRKVPSEFQVMLSRVDLTKSDKPVTSFGLTYRVTDGYVPDFTGLSSALTTYVSDTVRDRIIGGEN